MVGKRRPVEWGKSGADERLVVDVEGTVEMQSMVQSAMDVQK